jgi:hypothetical protein
VPTKLHERTSEVPVEEAGTNGLLSSLDDILALDDTAYETVHVPEWGRSIRLVSLTGEDRNRLAIATRQDAKRAKSSEDDELVMFQARVILASMVDADGLHIGDQGRARALMQKNGGALTRLYVVCARLSGLGREEADISVDDLKGTPSGDTGSD